MVPYINKTSEKFKRLCKNRGIQDHFRGTNTLRTALGNPKDKDPKSNQTGINYKYQCPHIQCTSSYIGESGRSLGERVKEHFKAPSPIHHHSATTGHPLDPRQFNIVHKEVNSFSRTIKEAMFICVQDPPQTGTWASTRCCIYGTIFYKPHPCSNTSQHHNQLTTCNPPTGPLPSTQSFLVLPLAIHSTGGHNFPYYFLWYVTCIPSKHPLSLSTIGLQQCHLDKFPL